MRLHISLRENLSGWLILLMVEELFMPGRGSARNGNFLPDTSHAQGRHGGHELQRCRFSRLILGTPYSARQPLGADAIGRELERDVRVGLNELVLLPGVVQP